MTSTTMPWVDYLPEVDDRILDRRNAIAALATTCLKLERGIVDARVRMAVARNELLLDVASRWTLADIEVAARRADLAGASNLQFTDPAMHAALSELNGDHTAVDAVLAFENVIARRLASARDGDPAAMRLVIESVNTWWQTFGVAVAERTHARESAIDTDGAQQ